MNRKALRESNKVWMAKHSALAAQFHYGDGGTPLSECTVDLQDYIQAIGPTRWERIREDLKNSQVSACNPTAKKV